MRKIIMMIAFAILMMATAIAQDTTITVGGDYRGGEVKSITVGEYYVTVNKALCSHTFPLSENAEISTDYPHKSVTIRDGQAVCVTGQMPMWVFVICMAILTAICAAILAFTIKAITMLF
jgi:hypothetical protein